MATKRGDQAREQVKNIIAEAFGTNYLTCLDKKLYVRAPDGPGGELIQFAITITMPKTEIDVTSSSNEVPAAEKKTYSLTAEDEASLNILRQKLGIDKDKN